MTTIIDYEVGNLASIKNMLKKIGENAVISSKAEDIINANKLILPGVGHFEYGIEKLKNMSYFDTLEQKVIKQNTPILGICLGAQLMLNFSEEGNNSKGLGWVNGEVIKFNEKNFDQNEKIPHMGWNTVKTLKNSMLSNKMPVDTRFYFVHSYYMQCKNQEDKLFETQYGLPFVSGFEYKNIMGVQFHPEKSHKFGMNLLSNFINNY